MRYFHNFADFGSGAVAPNDSESRNATVDAPQSAGAMAVAPPRSAGAMALERGHEHNAGRNGFSDVMRAPELDSYNCRLLGCRGRGLAPSYARVCTTG